MKALLYTLIAFTVFTTHIKAQTQLLIGDKAYSATDNWLFDNNMPSGYYDQNKVTFCVAKDGEQGLFSITMKVANGGKLKGPCTIYLLDNTVITCSTVITTDLVDEKHTILFRLTHDEVVKMSKSRITTVRYNYTELSGVKAYTADNSRQYFGMPGSKPANFLDYYETDAGIKRLFAL